MYGMMATNIAIPDQKKRGNNSNCPDITKYFASPKIQESVPNSGNEEIQDYFKRSCAPLDLSQPGNIYPRSSMHTSNADDQLANKWPPARNEHECDAVMKYVYKDDVNMDRIERQMFQDLDPRMCHSVDKTVELMPNQRLYQESALTLKYGREMKSSADLHNSVYAMPHDLKHEIIDDKAPMNNAYGMMMSNERAMHGRDDIPPMPKNPVNNSDCLYSGESHPYKWVPDLNTSLDEFKIPENEMRDQRQELISLVNMDTCPASMPLDNTCNTQPADPICSKGSTIYAPQNNLQPQGAAMPEDQNVQVISYEEFLKSEGLSVPSKEKTAELNANSVEPAKKQSNIRKFFTRVPRTVEVKFDHKRLVTVTAVVHPQPQSPRKLNTKKPIRKQTPRRSSTSKQFSSKGSSDNSKVSYNMRQRKSNVVVDIEEIDLTIREMNADANEIPKKPWRLGRRRLRSYHSFDSKADTVVEDFKYSASKEKSVSSKCLSNSWHQLKVLDPKPLFLACDLPSPKPRRKKRSKSESSKDESEIEILTPRKSHFRREINDNCRKSARLNRSVDESDLEKNVLEKTDDGLSHKPLKSIYKSSVVQPDASSGLRLKLVRIGKKRHHHHHHHPRGHRHRHKKQHKNAKVRKAMELLQRAKESSFHRDSRSDDSGPRRSTRQSTTMVRLAMEGAKKAEELRQARITAQRTSPPTKRLRPRSLNEPQPLIAKSLRNLQSPRKMTQIVTRSDEKKADTVNKTPKKLASIFTQSRTKKKDQVQPKQDTQLKSVPVVVIDDAKQQFLRSGIPESLQLQVARQQQFDQIPAGSYPFAAVTHVAQRDSKETDKPPEVTERFGLKKLSEKLLDLSSTIPPPKNTIQLGSLTTISGKVSECYKSQIDKLVSLNTTLKPFPNSVVKDILASISRRSPRLPIKKLYRSYLMKRRKMEKLEIANNPTNQNEEPSIKKRPPENDDIIEIKEIVNELKRRKIEAPKNQSAGQNESSVNRGKDELAAIKNSIQKTEIEKVLAPEFKPSGGTKSTYLWTEKYHPTHSLDIIGNRKTVVQLKNWLVEWKEQSKAEARKTKEGLSKSKGHESDDSDFVLSEHEDDDYDNTMCNTVLITGPPGVGKTATVYAIAEELGYKVFEVNASSRRAGKQILSDLKEATQSHQVSLKSKKAASIFQVAKKGQKDSKESGKEDKEKSETSNGGNGNSGSMSLVLFEDVDLVFDNDDGFWHAVNSFMSTTKRPIVLTSSVDNYAAFGVIKGRFEEFKFRIPEPGLTAIHMQVLCLVENLYADFDDVYNLVYHNGGDVRKTILEIQYWVLSGGDKKVLEETLQGCSSQNANTPQSKVAAADSAIVVLDDSLDPDTFDTFTSGDFSTDENSLDGLIENKPSRADRQPIHKGCFESIHGLGVPTSSSIAHTLKTSPDARALSVLLEQCNAANIETCSHNLPHLLPIPTVSSLEKRKKPSNFLPALHATGTLDKSKALDVSWISDDGDEQPTMAGTGPSAVVKKETDPPTTDAAAGRQKEQKRLCYRALKSLSKLSDRLADLDATFDGLEQDDQKGRASHCWKWWYREAKCGSSEKASDAADAPEVPMLDLNVEMRASLVARSLQLHSHELDGTVKELRTKENEEALPLVTVETPTADFLPTLTGLNNSPYMKRRYNNQRVANCMSTALQTSHRPMVLDYMPYMRHICQAETTRQLCNTKRGGRFLHYLDAMPLTPSLLEYLNEEFP